MDALLEEFEAGHLSLAELFAELASRSAAAASSLSRQWKQSAQVKLLQRPPADRISAKQDALFLQTCVKAGELGQCLDEAFHLVSAESVEHAGKVLQVTLAARPVLVLAGVVMWLQQRPELLQLPEQATEKPPIADQRYCTLWIACSQGARGRHQQQQQQQQQQSNDDRSGRSSSCYIVSFHITGQSTAS
uniref:Uncharacterized protein n=1 Tax=Tetradesmus obliquus TaxID=3088 RepID=A0A383VES8_TETOB